MPTLPSWVRLLPLRRPGGSLGRHSCRCNQGPNCSRRFCRPEDLRANRMEGGGERSPPPAPAGGASPPLHPALAPLSFLLGRWRGEGEGGFPTINSFGYGEELSFSHSGKPVIAYTQKTWKLPSGEPMHAESGYWRPKPDGSIEVVISQSTGIVEVQKGTYDAEKKIVNLQSELVGNASKEITKVFEVVYDELLYAVQIAIKLASMVKEITRVFKVVNGELSYVVQMATKLASLQPHLKATLSKL